MFHRTVSDLFNVAQSEINYSYRQLRKEKKIGFQIFYGCSSIETVCPFWTVSNEKLCLYITFYLHRSLSKPSTGTMFNTKRIQVPGRMTIIAGFGKQILIKRNY